jgi:large subunit ribosomal protein L25
MHEKAPVLKATARERVGTRYNNRLRAAGKLPAVVYGRGKEPVSITLEGKQATSLIHKGEKVFRLDMPGTKHIDEGQMVLVRDLQFDYLGTNIVHVDLARVSLTDRVHTRVPLHFVGEARGLKTAGAIMMHPQTELEVECPVQDIPDFIEVSVADLDVGQSITTAGVKLPGGFKLLSDPHANVAQIVVQAEQVLTAEAGAADATAQPEVLTAKKPEEGAAGAAPAKGAAAPAKGAAPAKAAAPAAKPAAGGGGAKK